MSRIKIGDGVTNVTLLPFSDSNKADVDHDHDDLYCTKEEAASSTLFSKQNGEVIIFEDTVAQPVSIWTMKGNTTQASAPSPSAPVALVSAGAEGTANDSYDQRNLFSSLTASNVTHLGVTYSPAADGFSTHIEGVSTSNYSTAGATNYTAVALPEGTYRVQAYASGSKTDARIGWRMVQNGSTTSSWAYANQAALEFTVSSAGTTYAFVPYVVDASSDVNCDTWVVLTRESGRVTGYVGSSNLYDASGATSKTSNGITFTNNNDGTITVIGTATANASTTNRVIALAPGVYSKSVFTGAMFVVKITTSSGQSSYHGSATKFTVNKGDTVYAYLQVSSGSTVDMTIAPVINYGETLLPWAPYNTRIVSAPVPEGLAGIMKGDSIVADEIDFINKKLIRRIGTITLDGSEAWVESASGTGDTFALPFSAFDVAPAVNGAIMSTHFVAADSSTPTVGECAITNQLLCCWTSAGTTTLDAFKTQLAQSPMTIAYELAASVTEPMDSRLFEAPRALESSDGTTVLYNCDGCIMTAALPSESMNSLTNMFAPIDHTHDLGSNVEYTPVVTSGTKVGTLTIDEVSTDIFVPSSQTPEILISDTMPASPTAGLLWIDIS